MRIRQTLARVTGDLVDMVRTRIELFGLELNIETSRVFGLLMLACAGIVFALLTVLIFSLLIAEYYWDTPQRLFAIGSLAGAYALIAVVCIFVLCRRMKNAPAPFQATMQELERDVQMFARLSNPADQRSESGRSDSEHKGPW